MRAQANRRTARAPRRAAPVVPVEVVLDGLAGCACLTLDVDGTITSWTGDAERVFGYASAAVIGRHVRALQPPEERSAERAEALLAEACERGRAHDDGRRRRADGTDLMASETVTAMRDDGGELVGFVVITQDLTFQYAAAERWRTAHARSAALLEHWRGAACVIDRSGHLTYATQALATMVGSTVAAISGCALATLVRSSDTGRLNAVVGALDEPHAHAGLEVRLQRGDDPDVWRDARLELTNRTDDPYIDGFVVNAYEAVDRDDAHDLLRWEAEHDPLTGLPNRAHLLARLHTPAPEDGDMAHVALLVVDLDNFKLLNDDTGHYAGDHLLMELAARLNRLVRPGDTVARLGGDEFGILMASPVWEGEAEALAERVRAAVAEPVELLDRPITVTASVGVALGADCHHSELLQSADTALHRAKERGRDRVEVYHPDLRTRVHHRVETEQSLRQALDAGEMIVHYQPVVDIATQRVVGAEALLRIRDADGNAHLPTSLITVAEETGLIVPIGMLVVADACRQLVEWRRELGDLAPHKVAVNLSPRQLASKALAPAVERLLREHGVEAAALCLEITESSVISADPIVLDNVRALHELGVPLVIDDFGTGYSGFAYVTRFPIAGLKIDRSFVTDVADDHSADAIVRAIVTMASALDLFVVAEGIETEAQHAALSAMGCDHGQGWLWSRAVPGAELVSVARRLSAVVGG